MLRCSFDKASAEVDGAQLVTGNDLRLKLLAVPEGASVASGGRAALTDLKKAADANAGVWEAFHLIQTYEEQIADAFQYSDVLVIGHRTDALTGALSADRERLIAWCTTDSVTLDPMGRFNELQKQARSVDPGLRARGPALLRAL